MSDAVWLALIGLAGLLVKEAADWWKQWRMEDKTAAVKKTVERVEAHTNSLVERVAENAHAAGRAEGEAAVLREGVGRPDPPGGGG